VTRGRADDGASWLGLAAVLALGALVVACAGPDGGRFDANAPWTRALEWRPGDVQPWRWWTAAWVHWSPAHLAVNLLGAAAIAFVGWRARLPRAAALAWFVAWPLTQALMDLPGAARLAGTLQHYGGLSGVLHAGVVVLALCLLRTQAPAPPPRPDAPTTHATVAPSRITEGPWAMTALEDGSAWQRLDEPPWPEPLVPLAPAQARRHRLVGAALLAGTLAKVLLEAPWDLALRPSAMLGIQVAPLAHACGVTAGAVAWGLVALAGRLRRPEAAVGH